MEIIEVNGKKYSRQIHSTQIHSTQTQVSSLFRPIIPEQTKPIDIIKPIKPIKPIFVCNGQCGICKDKKCFII